MPARDRGRLPGDPARANLPGMDTPLATARIVRFLEKEPVVWLSTVRPDGRPHLVPTWFWWDGEALLVFSKPDARKVRNLRGNPSVMLALGDAEEDFDIGLVEARAELLDRPTAKVLPAAHLEKYADQLGTIGMTPASTRRPIRRSSGSCRVASSAGTASPLPCPLVSWALLTPLSPSRVVTRSKPGTASRWPPAGGSCPHLGSSHRPASDRRSSAASARRSGAGCVS